MAQMCSVCMVDLSSLSLSLSLPPFSLPPNTLCPSPPSPYLSPSLSLTLPHFPQRQVQERRLHPFLYTWISGICRFS